MKKNITALLIILSLFLLSLGTSAAGGMEYNARHPALTAGIAALNWNPAWRSVYPHRFQIYTELMAFDLWNNTLDPQTFEYLFTKHWADEGEEEALKEQGFVPGKDYILKEEVLDTIPEEGIVIGASGQPQVGILIGPLAVRGQIRGYSHLSLDKDVIRLFIEGNQLNEYYSVQNTGGEASSWLDLSGSIALPIHPVAQLLHVENFYVGGTFHYLEGLGFGKVFSEGKGFRLRFEEDDIGVDGENTFILQYGTQGRGQSLDLGVYSEIRPGVSAGISVMDLLGRITWQGVTQQQIEVVLGEETEGEMKEERIPSVSQNIPTSLNLGLAYNRIPRVGIGGGVSRVLLEDRSYNEASIGVEWRGFLILPSIRAGVQYREGVGTTLYGGTGIRLGPIRTDIGFSDLRLPLKQGTGVTIGLSTSFAF